ncbi:hypothetical protein D3C71_1186080 [compost metagenome]
MDYTDEEWRDLFASYRLEVVRAGFGDWDRLACAEPTEQSPRAAFRRYARDFVYLLKARGQENRANLISRLGELVRDREGRPVSDVRIVSADGESRHFLELPIGADEARAFAALNKELFGGAPDDDPDAALTREDIR